ncbi:MAG TPA: bifunctional DNA-formamidopyrimidine glycosylase/DNA-(apurinic or apyrimidinic site) lyase [Rickettsiales bacterium]|nr:bifunctional DNA-formamidopyrimidine glycosylase/DNA-(apurinic or apyrimidinic site) lyase [Rickettsiales bacterium]
MPELPEVETIKIGLKKKITNKKIVEIFRSNKNLRIESELDLNAIEGKKIKNIKRRARYLIIEIEKYSLIIHLGMSGRLVFKTSLHNPEKHDHFICEFDDGSSLIFNDPRRFGFIDLIFTKNLSRHKFLTKLGFEPFDKIFDKKYLAQQLKNKTTNIKTTMMDNAIVVGVGNIYINESLFAAKISPLRKANSLSTQEIAKLIVAIRYTLKNAIKSGGSSINDYVDTAGNVGNFQNNFKVYGLNKKNCLECNSVIEKIVQNGRSSFYCKKCQL